MLLSSGMPTMTYRPKDWRNDIMCKFYPDCKCGDACPYKHDPELLNSAAKARALQLEAARRQRLGGVGVATAATGSAAPDPPQSKSSAAGRMSFTEAPPPAAAVPSRPAFSESRRTFTEAATGSRASPPPAVGAKRTFTEMAQGDEGGSAPVKLAARGEAAMVAPERGPVRPEGATVPVVAELD